MYFKNMPVINYDIGNIKKVCRNIMVCAKFSDLFRGADQEQLFVEYLVKDGETPEEIAHRVYGSASLHWVLLLFNNIINPYFEWPLSQSDLDELIYKSYPGSAIFVDISSTFNRTNGVTLPSKKSNFVVGEAVAHEDGTWAAIIKRWDPTLRKLEIDSIDGTFDANISDTYTGKIISVNSDGHEFEANMKRVVFDNTYALHHFEDSNGEYIDPYQDFAGRTNNRTSLTDDALSGDFILKRYIEQGYDTDVVVNRLYEDNLNDSRRQIKVLKIEYVQKVIDTYISIFNG
jgi:hypothetical protein